MQSLGPCSAGAAVPENLLEAVVEPAAPEALAGQAAPGYIAGQGPPVVQVGLSAEPGEAFGQMDGAGHDRQEAAGLQGAGGGMRQLRPAVQLLPRIGRVGDDPVHADSGDFPSQVGAGEMVYGGGFVLVMSPASGGLLFSGAAFRIDV